MSIRSFPDNHPPTPRHAKLGILLVNLGSPDDTSVKALRRYLREFLSDARVIELPRFWWWLILNFIVLRRRPARSAAAYARIWLAEVDGDADGAPLRKYTARQAAQLHQMLAEAHDSANFVVDWAMRYGKPAIPERLDALQQAGCKHLLILPLYPQYAAATTASVQDEIFRWMLKQRWQPSLRFVAPWHDHPAYIQALTASIRAQFNNTRPDALLMSFHGIPQRYFTQGDPYHCHAMKTARLLKESLGWEEVRIEVAFQSRFGREEWIKPYTDEVIESLAKDGMKHLAIIAPGFSVDCLETLEELNIEGRAAFLRAGGAEFTYIPCLNDGADGMRLIKILVDENSGGWL